MSLLVGSVLADDLIETITFEWDDPNEAGAVKNFEMYWGVTAGGPYTKLVVIPYALTSPVQATVTGPGGSTQTRFFVLTACGDMPQEGGGTEYRCSETDDDPPKMAFSNEVSHDFWIPVGSFSVPVQFRKVPTQ